MEESERGRCPLCGGERSTSSMAKEAELRVDILRLRQHLEDMQRGVGGLGRPPTSQGDIQDRIEQALSCLSGGYGATSGE